MLPTKNILKNLLITPNETIELCIWWDQANVEDSKITIATEKEKKFKQNTKTQSCGVITVISYYANIMKILFQILFLLFE